MKYIDSNKLIAEIDRRKIGYNTDGKHSAEYNTCREILHIVTSLQQEQPYLPSNLDEAALKAYPKMSRISEPHGVIPADNKTHYLGDANEENRIAFKAGAEWRAEQDAKNINSFQQEQQKKTEDLEKFISDFFDKKDAENNGRWSEDDIVEAITKAYELGVNARSK